MASALTEISRPFRLHLSRGAERTVPPALVLIVLLVTWEFSSDWFDVPKYLLPAPTDFMGRFVTDWRLIGYNALATAFVVVIGFIIATFAAIPLGLALASSPSLQRNLMPVIVFFEIIPKTIAAPLFVVWLGFGFPPRILLTVVMTFFPILLNSVAGFTSINPRLHLITKSMGASPWQSFRFIRLPAAMPYIFSGMKIGSVFAVSACMTAEFIGANEGLMALILSATDYMDLDLMFAGIMATAILGTLFTGILLGLEKWLMPWRSDQ